MARRLPQGRATNALAASIFLAFLVVQLAGLTDRIAIYAGFIPARVHALAAEGVDVAMDWLPVWLTPLSSTFVHAGWMHIAFNLVIFLYIGRLVEHLLGPQRLLIIYAVGAYAAAAGQWAMNPAGLDPVVGASGAISAVLGTYALIYSQREVKPIGPIPAQVVRIVWMAAGWTVLQLMIGLVGPSAGPLGSVAIGAHIGGFIAGLLLARPMLHWRFGVRPR